MTISHIQPWLSDYFGSVDFAITPLAGDASFRLYYRVYSAEKTYIAMDASAERDKCPQFIAIANALRSQGLQTPEIIAKNVAAGFLLLSDFGDDQLLQVATAESQAVLYGKAIDALVLLSQCKQVSDYQLPLFTAHFMREELAWFQEWYLEKHLGLTLSLSTRNDLAVCFDLLAKSGAAQAQVFMHRDYHSANLMVLPDTQIGILDFQDAFIGPVTYDLVSLLRDCYKNLPDDLVEKLVWYYYEKASVSVSKTEFMRWFDWMGVQRHLKVLLTFSRKYRRDHNPNYLQYIPRTLDYIIKISARYPELIKLQSFLQLTREEQACAP